MTVRRSSPMRRDNRSLFCASEMTTWFYVTSLPVRSSVSSTSLASRQIFFLFLFLPRLDVSCLLNDTALLFASRLLTSGFNRTTLRHWINDINSLVRFTRELQSNSSKVSLFKCFLGFYYYKFFKPAVSLPSCYAAAVRLTQLKSAVAKMTRRLDPRHFR